MAVGVPRPSSGEPSSPRQTSPEAREGRLERERARGPTPWLADLPAMCHGRVSAQRTQRSADPALGAPATGGRVLTADNCPPGQSTTPARCPQRPGQKRRPCSEFPGEINQKRNPPSACARARRGGQGSPVENEGSAGTNQTVGLAESQRLARAVPPSVRTTRYRRPRDSGRRCTAAPAQPTTRSPGER